MPASCASIGKRPEKTVAGPLITSSPEIFTFQAPCTLGPRKFAELTALLLIVQYTVFHESA